MTEIIRKTTLSDDGKGLTFILSDETPDHYNDIIRVNGWKNLPESLIALVNHSSDFMCGRWKKPRIEGNKLKADLVLAPAGASSRIDEIRALVTAGVLRNCSVGFKPIRQRPRENGGIEYLEQHLLECSLVAVGANPAAMLEAKKLGCSNEIIKMVFREQTRNASLAERVESARAAVRFTERQKREIHEKGLAMRAKIKAERESATRSAAREQNLKKLRAAADRLEKEIKDIAKEQRQEMKDLEPDPELYTVYTWRGQKIPVARTGTGDVDEFWAKASRDAERSGRLPWDKDEEEE